MQKKKYKHVSDQLRKKKNYIRDLDQEIRRVIFFIPNLNFLLVQVPSFNPIRWMVPGPLWKGHFWSTNRKRKASSKSWKCCSWKWVIRGRWFWCIGLC